MSEVPNTEAALQWILEIGQACHVILSVCAFVGCIYNIKRHNWPHQYQLTDVDLYHRMFISTHCCYWLIDYCIHVHVQTVCVINTYYNQHGLPIDLLKIFLLWYFCPKYAYCHKSILVCNTSVALLRIWVFTWVYMYRYEWWSPVV